MIAEARKRCEAVPHLMDVVSGLMQIDWRLRMTYEVGTRASCYVGIAEEPPVRYSANRGSYP